MVDTQDVNFKKVDAGKIETQQEVPKHLTQEEMAFRISKSKDTVSNIERGLAFARIETLIDICNELEVELKDLFDYPISNDITSKKARIIQEISKFLAGESEEKIAKYLDMLRLMW